MNNPYEGLPASMYTRMVELAEALRPVGYSDADAPLLAKWIVAENEWKRITNLVNTALARGDSAEASKWIAAQDRIVSQSVRLSESLNMSPKTRIMNGVPYLGTGRKKHDQRRQIQISAQ